MNSYNLGTGDDPIGASESGASLEANRGAVTDWSGGYSLDGWHWPREVSHMWGIPYAADALEGFCWDCKLPLEAVPPAMTASDWTPNQGDGTLLVAAVPVGYVVQHGVAVPLPTVWYNLACSVDANEFRRWDLRCRCCWRLFFVPPSDEQPLTRDLDPSGNVHEHFYPVAWSMHPRFEVKHNGPDHERCHKGEIDKRAHIDYGRRCPNDTDGDGHCGRRGCPICGGPP